MDTPTLVLIAIVLATFAIFGPKPNFKKEKQPKTIKVKQVEHAPALPPLVPESRLGTYASQYAAGRAPSPLQTRAARPAPQFALAGEKAPLPHEFSRQ